jgi:hypothetical protein
MDVHYCLVRPGKDASCAAKRPDMWLSSARMCLCCAGPLGWGLLHRDLARNGLAWWAQRSKFSTLRELGAVRTAGREKRRKTRARDKTVARLGSTPGRLYLSATNLTGGSPRLWRRRACCILRTRASIPQLVLCQKQSTLDQQQQCVIGLVHLRARQSSLTLQGTPSCRTLDGARQGD